MDDGCAVWMPCCQQNGVWENGQLTLIGSRVYDWCRGNYFHVG
jgi:hypothetical protein